MTESKIWRIWKHFLNRQNSSQPSRMQTSGNFYQKLDPSLPPVVSPRLYRLPRTLVRSSLPFLGWTICPPQNCALRGLVLIISPGCIAPLFSCASFFTAKSGRAAFSDIATMVADLSIPRSSRATPGRTRHPDLLCGWMQGVRFTLWYSLRMGSLGKFYQLISYPPRLPVSPGCIVPFPLETLVLSHTLKGTRSGAIPCPVPLETDRRQDRLSYRAQIDKIDDIRRIAQNVYLAKFARYASQ